MARASPTAAVPPQGIVLLHLAVSFIPEVAVALAAAQAGMTHTALVRRIVEEWLRERQYLLAAPGTEPTRGGSLETS